MDGRATLKKRLLWADYTKAFAIWLMVLCHFGIGPGGLVDLIYVFHMPVFFMVSGYFDRLKPFTWNLLKSNLRRIMIPYFLFSLCSLSTCWVSPYLHPEIYNNSTVAQSMIKAVIGMLLMEDQVRPYSFMPAGSLWFLVALFTIKIVVSLICWSWTRCKIMIAFIACVGTLIVYNNFPFFSLDSAFISLPIYMVGVIARRYNMVEHITSRKILVCLASICWAYTTMIGVRNGKVDIDGCVTGHCLLLFYTNGVIGSLACIYTAKLITKEIPFLLNVGSSTLAILGTHGYIGTLAKVFAVIFMGMSAQNMSNWYVILIAVIALLFGVKAHKILRKYCPIMIGN